jgi:genome maintenance exonuclease 1|tara:strand:+ start:514 stop:1194 length:681 start_codon:yes stop_codon:yes gene_type:complete
MIKLNNAIELHDLESLELKTTNVDGKRYYTDADETFYYPSVTSVTGLLSSDQIKLWRERVGAEEANKITKHATNRGTTFHQLVEDYLRKEVEYIEFDNILQEGMFKAMKPVLDDIIPIALEAPLYSDVLHMAGRVDCVGIYDDVLQIIDFKTSGKFKEEYMAKNWYIQMTAYAIMVEELTGHEIEEITAIVAIEGHNTFQIFSADPRDYVDELNDLRVRYKNIYGV